MLEHCPACGLAFEREQGYFLGAMCGSYPASILPVLALILLTWRLSGQPFDWSIGAAFFAYLPCAGGGAFRARGVDVCGSEVRPAVA
jgi:hypothetical protein